VLVSHFNGDLGRTQRLNDRCEVQCRFCCVDFFGGLPHFGAFYDRPKKSMHESIVSYMGKTETGGKQQNNNNKRNTYSTVQNAIGKATSDRNTLARRSRSIIGRVKEKDDRKDDHKNSAATGTTKAELCALSTASCRRLRRPLKRRNLFSASQR
jgi:hypothetical protein